MDNVCYDVLFSLNLPDVHLIPIQDFEKNDQELLQAKKNRTKIEYYFTCTPSLPLYILNNFPQVDMITYLDADLFFFADPAPLYEEIGNHSIGIIPHRFETKLRKLEKYGIYNVGFLAFRRDAEAVKCLLWWRAKCIEWCYDRIESGRYADQKYLDIWPQRFNNLVVLQHKGANLAPWNIANYHIVADGNGVWIDKQPLIFFHFHGFKKINAWMYDTNLTFFQTKLTRVMKRSIFEPYIEALSNVTPKISSLTQGKRIHNGLRYRFENFMIWSRVWKAIDRFFVFWRVVYKQNFILVLKDRIL